MPRQEIVIIDFGSQFTQLIARRLRELQFYCEIVPHTKSVADLKKKSLSGIILSGGPYSVYDKNAPKIKNPKALLDLKVPILGICYGMQWIAKSFGSPVLQAKVREYGRTEVKSISRSDLIPSINGKWNVWMSHGDEIGSLPDGFVLTAVSQNQSPAAMEDKVRRIYAVQFHPEVSHTQYGMEILKRFAVDICQMESNWNMGMYLAEQMQKIRDQVGKKKIICALSGGVDSTVAAKIVDEAVGDKLRCVFVNNGLLRKNESHEVMELYEKNLKLNVTEVDASAHFLKALRGVADPEKKRKIIGREFIRIFEKHAKGASFLVQGTLYPDVIESSPPPHLMVGKKVSLVAHKIKSHHNVGGLPSDLKFKLIEPLRELFKDEVRLLGRELQIPEKLLMRHPFPGPGLGVRVLGEVTEKRLETLRAVDAIFLENIRAAGLYSKIWQAFAVLLESKSVGVMGDGRTFDNVVALRAVTSQDAMTADWYRFEMDFLEKVSSEITNQVKGVNRVVYDISSKPPSTIEWE